MTTELRNCPFCGGEAVLEGKAFCWVRCKECGTESKGDGVKKVVINKWNTRVYDDLMEGMEYGRT